MNGISSDTTSVVTATPGQPVAVLVLQQIQEHVVRAASEFGEIKSPETRHKDKVALVDELIGQSFKRLREGQSGDYKAIEDEIVRYAGERKILETEGLRDAENEYGDQFASLLQSLSERLVITIGPAIVKRLLQKVVSENPDQRLRDDPPESSEQDNAHPESAQVSADCYLENEESSAMGESEPESDTEYCPSSDMERNTADKHPLNNPDHTLHTPRMRCKVPATTMSSTQQQCEVSYPENEHPDTSNGGSELIAVPLTTNPQTAEEDQVSTSSSVALLFVDADNFAIGVLKQALPWGNERVDAILSQHIKRPVSIRRARRFNKAHLHAISKQSDMKGVKLVSCMIQGTGVVMDRRCQYCKKNQGAFEDCIMLDDDLFQRCGNCEWSRQRCVPYARTALPVSSEEQVQRYRTGKLPSRYSVRKSPQGRPPRAMPQPPNPAVRLTALNDPKAISSRPNWPFQAGTMDFAPQTAPQDTIATYSFAHGKLESVHDRNVCYADDFSDTDSYSGVAVTRNDWKIHQIKTRLFTSAEGLTQYWSWANEDQCLKYVVLKGSTPVQWEFSREPVNFDVKLDEVVEVRGSVKSLRVCLVMKEDSSLSKQGEAPRGDVMVVFRRERTTRRFLKFCRDRIMVVIEEEPPIMVHMWRNMESATLLSDGK